jgi:DNA-binding transcriptional ArsR family regulator
VTQLTRVLTNIAKQTGAAVVLIAHSPKSVLGKEGDEINAADIAGSSAFVDNSRAAFMAYGMRKEEAKHHHIAEEDRSSYVRLAAVKANYASSGGGYWFKRVVLPNWEVAVLDSVSLHSPAPFQRKSVTALRDRILEELRKKPGGVTARNLRDKSGTTGVLKASEAAVRREIEAMKEAGLVELRKPTVAELKQFKLSTTVRHVLVAL